MVCSPRLRQRRDDRSDYPTASHAAHIAGGRTHQVAMDLADWLSEMVPVSDAKMFFANSGSEANDRGSRCLVLLQCNGQTSEEKNHCAGALLSRRHYGCGSADWLAGHARTLMCQPMLSGSARFHSYYHGQQDGESEAAFVARLVNELEQLIDEKEPTPSPPSSPSLSAVPPVSLSLRTATIRCAGRC